MVMTQAALLDAIAELVGEDVLPVVKYLKGRKNISEFKIAEKVNLEVNITRNILYRLYANNLVTYHRKKDRQKGWYISYWTFNQKGVKHILKKMKTEKLEKLNERLAKESANTNSFFLCPSLCARLDFEKATEFEFKCPECGTLLNQQDNTKTIERLQEQIKDLKRDMAGRAKPKKKAAPKKKTAKKK